MKIKKNYLIMLGILAVLFLYIIINSSNFTKTRTIVRLRGLNTGTSIEDFHLTSKSILLWGDNTLFICDKDGNISKKIQRDDDKLTCIFVNKYTFLYDKDLKKVYQYSEFGELLNTIIVPGQILHISYENANIVFHIFDKDKEVLYILSNDNSLSEFYSTSNQILVHDIVDRNNFAVGELQISGNGYKSILNMTHGGKNIMKTINSEVLMFVKNSDKSTLFLSNKNLYRYLNDGEFYSSEVPNISDVIVDGKITYLLHSGILSKFNYKLEEVDKKIIAANVDKIEMVSNSIYVYGPSDIGGEIGRKGEFYTRLGYSIDKIEIEGLTIGMLRDNELNLYKISTKRVSNDESNDLNLNYE